MTKVSFHGYTPVASGNQIYLERPRIHRLLEQAAQKPVVSVVAGAGFGKSCAVYTYAKSINVSTAWIQISERDNLGERFWENFISAISIINGNTADKLRNIDFPSTDQQFERHLEIARQDVIPNEAYLFVYDDIHLLSDPAGIRFLELFINSRAFPNITSVLISRTEPALNMEKLVSKNLLARITENELRFNQEEMLCYFRLQNLAPAPQMTSAIYNDTEGWAFAIHLAGLSIKNSPNAAYIPRALRSNSFKLIESEIMDKLSAQLQSFLIKLSLIENYNPELVREIAAASSPDSSSTDAGMLIKEMESISSFIRFDSYLNSYHVHQLFMDYLRQRQNELSCEEKKEVWTKTALWCEANNHKMDAIICHEKTGDYNAIVKIFNTLPLILPPGMASFVLDILENAPKTIHEDCPGLFIIRSRTLASLGRFEQSRTETLEILPRFKLLPESREKHNILMGCYMNLGFTGLILSIYTRRYDFIDFFKKAACEAEKSGYVLKPPINSVILGSYMCRVSAPASKEDIERYIEMIGEIVPYSARAMGGYRFGQYELARGEFAFFSTELEEAEKLLLEGLAKAREKQQYEIENRCLFYLLRIYLSRGEADRIEQIFKQLEAELEESLFPNRQFYYDIVCAWYHIQTEQKDRIAQWIKKDYEKSALNYGAQGLERLIKAKYYLCDKRYPAALAVMDSRGNVDPCLMADLEMKVLDAVCRYRQQDRQGACIALQQAYCLAAPAGLFMPFIELGKDMRALTETALRDMKIGDMAITDKADGLHRYWLEEICRKASVYAKKLYSLKKQDSAVSGQRRVPLSRREINVLIGLSQGLTRQEIAGAASISPNTVKSAARSIYSKLGALNQADAVRIATEKGIL